MEKDSLTYIIIIILLVAAFVGVGSYAYRALSAPSEITELSFVKGNLLPNEVETGQIYPFSFSITNHDDAIRSYEYTILANGNTIGEGTVAINGGTEEIIDTEFSIENRQSGDDIQVAIQLKGMNQQIQQWVVVR